MLVTIIILLLVASMAGIGYGIRAIARELDGIEGDMTRKAAEDAERDAEKSRAVIEKWRKER